MADGSISTVRWISMKSSHSGFEPFRRVKMILTGVVIFGSCGCVHLATVKTIEPRIPAIAASDEQLRSATEILIRAGREQPAVSLGNDLTAAKISLNVLEQRPNDPAAQTIYNFSVARAVENVARANIQPWRQSIKIDIEAGKFSFSSPKPIDSEHDPSRYDLFPVDTLKIGGTFFKTRQATTGIGAPLVAVARTENPQFRQEYKPRRLYAPATAVIQFSGQNVDLKFVDPFQAEKISLNRRVFPLAVDLSAPIAMLIARERPERLGFSRLINPQKYADTARLTQLQPFDPARTPVIFVHGLQETPASWTTMFDSLRNDPWVRKHYQFWVYSYPSGYPYPYSAALFRQDLDGIDRAFPNHKRFVLIGHSMGGMICRLMITDSGDKIWRANFSTAPAQTPLSGETRKLLEESLLFVHRRDVQRVIFIATPHRGSKIAEGWIGRIGSSLVRTPRSFASIYASTKPLLVADPAARPLKRMPNSVDTLEPNDRFVQAVDKLPITPGIPYHSIMGDRGRGDTPNSSDGVVPYWSSHLEGAQSELIVNSDHGAQFNLEAIHEVARILKENLTAKN
jgi:pimeloyl-ACP methyl ester carboxylesterase